MNMMKKTLNKVKQKVINNYQTPNHNSQTLKLNHTLKIQNIKMMQEDIKKINIKIIVIMIVIGITVTIIEKNL